MKKTKELDEKIDNIALALEKTKINEYVDYINNRKRLIYINFIQGIARGFGMAIGFTLLGALFLYFLQELIKLNLPLIGDFIAEIVKIVKENLWWRYTMEQNKIEHYKKLLLREKKRIEDMLKKMQGNHPGAMEEYGTELSSYDNHPADLGTEMFMMEHDKGLKNKNEDIIYEIENSIEKLKSGDYGICEGCGVNIEEDRLELIPYTKLCLECSNKKIPLDVKMSFRPEEEDRDYPFKRRNIEVSDETDMNFDREDSYQAVARYNKVEKDPSNTTGDDQGIFDESQDGIVEEVEKLSEKYYKDTL